MTYGDKSVYIVMWVVDKCHTKGNFNGKSNDQREERDLFNAVDLTIALNESFILLSAESSMLCKVLFKLC